MTKEYALFDEESTLLSSTEFSNDSKIESELFLESDNVQFEGPVVCDQDESMDLKEVDSAENASDKSKKQLEAAQIYLTEIGYFPLLSAEQEIEIGRAIQRGCLNPVIK